MDFVSKCVECVVNELFRSVTRFDIQREVNKLKALVLPRHARDLYQNVLSVLLMNCLFRSVTRFDIQREVNKLKALVLPRHARDLYLGRGIHLPL